MSDVTIGVGKLAGKGVFADRDFNKGEVVIKYNLKPLTLEEYKNLPESEKKFVHTHKGQIYLYSEPERYVNHSFKGNVSQDLEKQADIALRDIKKGEEITGDATKDEIPLLKKVDAVLVKVPNIEAGLDFYWRQLGQQLLWKKEDTAAVRLGDSELVLSTKLDPEIDILVESIPDAIDLIVKAGGSVVLEPVDIDVGKAAVVRDPFGNELTLVDLSKGLYEVNESGEVTGVK
jgi:hypothetical protein